MRSGSSATLVICGRNGDAITTQHRNQNKPKRFNHLPPPLCCAPPFILHAVFHFVHCTPSLHFAHPTIIVPRSPSHYVYTPSFCIPSPPPLVLHTHTHTNFNLCSFKSVNFSHLSICNGTHPPFFFRPPLPFTPHSVHFQLFGIASSF